MLSPISPALTGPSASTGNDAMIFMSGSGSAPGIMTTGSSPGRQRSMLSGEPSELPKNRLGVLNEKLSRGGATLSATAGASGAGLRSSSGLASSDIDTSYCCSGGALSASCNSGSSGARSAAGAMAAVLAPITDALDVDGSSFAGTATAGAAASAGWGDATTRRSPFSVRSTLGKSDVW